VTTFAKLCHTYYSLCSSVSEVTSYGLNNRASISDKDGISLCYYVHPFLYPTHTRSKATGAQSWWLSSI